VATLVAGPTRPNNSNSQEEIELNNLKSYMLATANGSGTIKCTPISVDGAWLYCDGRNEWVNTNAMMSAVDSSR
jgi:hypothetical protein